MLSALAVYVKSVLFINSYYAEYKKPQTNGEYKVDYIHYMQ